MKWFKNKRIQVAKTLPKRSVLILASRPEYLRQEDVLYPYRQDSHFYYMTGLDQSPCLFLLFSSGSSIIFSKDRDLEKEIWDGPTYSQTEIKKKFLIDRVFSLSEIDKKLTSLLKNQSQIFYTAIHPAFDKK